ncbi:MAG: hypothetical protein V4581_15515 [Bacteroidota bacterium]
MVHKAESDIESAIAVNVTGAKNLAEACKGHGCINTHKYRFLTEISKPLIPKKMPRHHRGICTNQTG